MFNRGSKVKLAEASDAVLGLQRPSKTPSFCPALAQSYTKPFARLLNENDGPVSDFRGTGEPVDEDPGASSYFRSHFSTFQECPVEELSTQLSEVAFTAAGAPTIAVSTRKSGRAPVAVGLGMQKSEPARVVQLKSTFSKPVARALDLISMSALSLCEFRTGY